MVPPATTAKISRKGCERLKREEPEITLWRTREEMVGGVGWWKQITEAIDAVEFIVLVMTRRTMASQTLPQGVAIRSAARCFSWVPVKCPIGRSTLRRCLSG